MAAINVTSANGDTNDIANGGRVLVRNSAGNAYAITRNVSDSSVDMWGPSGIVDEYLVAPGTGGTWLYSGFRAATSQSFSGDGEIVSAISVRLWKSGAPTGNATFALYAHAGTYGTSSVPTGSALASGTLDVSTLTTTEDTWVKVNLSSEYTLSASTYYCVVISYSGGDTDNKLHCGIVSSAGAHSGNNAYNSGSWTANSVADTPFIVHAYGGGAFYEPDSANKPTGTLYGAVSAAIDSSDIIHIAYMSDAGKASPLLYATFRADGVNDDWLTTDVSLVADVGEDPTAITNLYTAIAIDSADKPHIAFTRRLKLGGTLTFILSYINKTSGSWGTVYDVEATQGKDIANCYLTIDYSDLPVVAYLNSTDGDIGAAIGNGNNATSYTINDVDTDAAGSGASVAVDSGGNHWIAYTDAGDGYVYLIKHNESDGWTTWQTRVTNSNAGLFPSLFADGTDIYIFYENDANEIAYDMYNGSTWADETVLETVAEPYNTVKVAWAFLHSFDSGGVELNPFSKTSAYYLDVSDAGPRDDEAVWTDDGNFFNGSTANYAYGPSTNVGTETQRELRGEGTNAPASGDTITTVKVRVSMSSDDGSQVKANFKIYENGGITELASGDADISSATGVWSDYFEVSVPSGGWDWTDVQNLEIVIWATSIDLGSFIRIHAAEFSIVTFSTPNSPAEISYVFTDESSPYDIWFNTLVLAVDTNDELAGTNITAQSPTLTTGVVAIPDTNDELVGTDVVAQAPTLDTGTLNQEHNLTAVGITSQTPTLDTGTLNQEHNLTATGITSQAPTLDTATLTEDTNNELAGSDIVSQASTLDTATLTEDTNNELTGSDIVSQAPTLDTATLTEDTNNELIGSDIASQAPTLDIATLTSIVNKELAGFDIVSQVPTLNTGTLNQEHNLVAVNITTGIPTLTTGNITEPGSPIGQLITLGIGIPSSISGFLTFGFDSSLTQLVGSDITTETPVLTTGVITQNHNLAATDIVSQAPALDTGVLNQKHNLVAADIFSQAPTLDTGVLNQEHNLVAADITSQAPILDTGILSQEHNLAAIDIVSQAPVLDTATLTEDTNNELIGLDIVTGKPTISLASLVGDTNNELTAVGITTQVPVLDTGVLYQGHNLIADDIVSQASVLNTGVLNQEHNFVAADIVSQTPVLDTGILNQEHNLVAVDITSSAPTIDIATLIEDTNNELVAQNILSELPVLDKATLTQEYTLVGSYLIASPPTLDQANVTVHYVLTADGITTEQPVLGLASMAQELVAFDITTESPTLTYGFLGLLDALVGHGFISGQPIVDTGKVTPYTSTKLCTISVYDPTDRTNISIDWPIKNEGELIIFTLNWLCYTELDPIVSSIWDLDDNFFMWDSGNDSVSTMIGVGGGMDRAKYSMRNTVTLLSGVEYTEVIKFHVNNYSCFIELDPTYISGADYVGCEEDIEAYPGGAELRRLELLEQ